MAVTEWSNFKIAACVVTVQTSSFFAESLLPAHGKAWEIEIVD
jgi:hypothetical protein